MDTTTYYEAHNEAKLLGLDCPFDCCGFADGEDEVMDEVFYGPFTWERVPPVEDDDPDGLPF